MYSQYSIIRDATVRWLQMKFKVLLIVMAFLAVFALVELRPKSNSIVEIKWGVNAAHAMF